MLRSKRDSVLTSAGLLYYTKTYLKTYLKSDLMLVTLHHELNLAHNWYTEHDPPIFLSEATLLCDF